MVKHRRKTKKASPKKTWEESYGEIIPGKNEPYAGETILIPGKGVYAWFQRKAYVRRGKMQPQKCEFRKLRSQKAKKMLVQHQVKKRAPRKPRKVPVKVKVSLSSKEVKILLRANIDDVRDLKTWQNISEPTSFEDLKIEPFFEHLDIYL